MTELIFFYNFAREWKIEGVWMAQEGRRGKEEEARGLEQRWGRRESIKGGDMEWLKKIEGYELEREKSEEIIKGRKGKRC